MGLLVECPRCRTRNSVKAERCRSCGLDLKKAAGKVWWIEYYDYQKKRRRERIGPSRRAAELRLAEVKRELAEGKVVPEKQKGNIVFEDFWENFYRPWIQNQNSLSWLKRKDLAYRLYLRPYFGNHRLKDVNRGMVERYVQKRLNEGASPATVNREVAILKHVFAKAVEWELAVHNPAAGVKKLKEREDAWNVIPEEEWKKILEALPEGKRPLFEFLWHTGVRLGNAVNLTWDQVNLEEGWMRIPAAATKQKKELLLPLSDKVVSILVSQKEKNPASELVFPSSSGSPFDRHNLRKAWLSALKKAGLEKKGYRIHDIRHTFGARAVKAGVDVRIIKELLGHSTLEMVLRYTHVDFTSLKEALNRMSSAGK